MCGLGNQESGDGGDKGASWVPPVPSGGRWLASPGSQQTLYPSHKCELHASVRRRDHLFSADKMGGF